jgi:hypothetical protein
MGWLTKYDAVIVPSDQWFSLARKVKGLSSLQHFRQWQIVQ